MAVIIPLVAGVVLVYGMPCVGSRDPDVCAIAACDDTPPAGCGKEVGCCSPDC